VAGLTRQDGELACDGVPLADLAGRLSTPLFVYSGASIRAAHATLSTAFASYPHTLHYALKANSTLAIVRLFRSLGCQADANSGGEIDVALRAGFHPSDIVFTGVGKTHDELARAVALGVKAINIESQGEAHRIDAIARSRGVRARVAVRVNPDIDPHSHPHISTGLRLNKFGVPIEQVPALFRTMAGCAGLETVGLHVHLGSQILDMAPMARVARALADLAAALRASGAELRHLDLGGGLGVPYDESAGPDPEAYAAAVLPMVRETGLHLLLEPGRYLIARAGVLVGRVTDRKTFPGSPDFVVLDTGMTELIRPALYGAFHRIEEVRRREGPGGVYEIVGPLCETSDTLGHGRALGPIEVGDLLAIRDAGAYGAVMASNYNRRPMAAEVLVDQGAWRVIRRRQTIDDLVALEE
jgi:diaminopimelate decarboxylase